MRTKNWKKGRAGEEEKGRLGKVENSFPSPLVALFLLLLCSVESVAQQANGTITGRVIADDGQPIPHAVVNLSGLSGVGGGGKRATGGRLDIFTNDDGNFVAEGLDPIPYSISAWAPGYVPAQLPSPNPQATGDARFTYVGESVTVTLIRGGVITGRVTDAAGEPVIGVPVKVTRIRDEAGRPNQNSGFERWMNHTTDDRGVYRVYGLAPGSYIVAAGGADPVSSRATPFAGRMTTYHPSSTRDAATMVKVSSGAEATAIDIRYRDENGFAISGRISGGQKAAPGTAQIPTEIYLLSPATGETIATTSFHPINNQNGYAFYGIPNGEYEVVAQYEGMEGENGLASTPRRITVKGADVTGIDLTLAPNAAISGTFAIEKAAAGAQKCESRRDSYLEEIIVKARRDEPKENSGGVSPGYGVGVPHDKSAFTIRNLKPGRHRIELELPDETWYLKAMTITGKSPVIDPRGGIALKSGDKLTGLNLTIAPDAASIKGKVAAAENAKLPPRLRVHLIPAETEAKDDLLRFAERGIEVDGGFTFVNLAPGKYFLLARTITDSEADKPSRPAAWEAGERVKLRKEAETGNTVIELKPCQRITEHVLRLTK